MCGVISVSLSIFPLYFPPSPLLAISRYWQVHQKLSYIYIILNLIKLIFLSFLRVLFITYNVSLFKVNFRLNISNSNVRYVTKSTFPFLFVTLQLLTRFEPFFIHFGLVETIHLSFSSLNKFSAITSSMFHMSCFLAFNYLIFQISGPLLLIRTPSPCLLNFPLSSIGKHIFLKL